MNSSYYLQPLKKEYIQDNKGDVYKVLPDHYLKLSPWKNGEDRRVSETDMGDYSVITYKNACMIINKQFNSTVEQWDRNGKHYIANSLAENNNTAAHSYMLSTLPNHKVFLKDAKNVMKYTDNMSITNPDGTQELKLVRHKGKIYYIMIINEFLPRVKAYNLFGEFCQWIGIDTAKPIFCETDNRFI